jgi:hypothetical protein
MDLAQAVDLLPFRRISEGEALDLLRVNGAKRFDMAMLQGVLYGLASYGLILRHNVPGTFTADVERVKDPPKASAPKVEVAKFTAVSPVTVTPMTLYPTESTTTEHSPGVTFTAIA